MHFKKNDRIDSYTVMFPHKQGSYAETYRVKDAAGKTCFLKLFNYSKLNRNQIDDNGCLTEVEIAKRLNHPNLCKCIDTGSIIHNGGQYAYLVTEYISGETLLQKIVREGDLSVYEIKQVAKAVLSALSYLHQLPVPVVHGEVTVQNVLLDLVKGTKNLKLIDYGHANFLNQKPVKPDLTDLNVFYLAPERFSGVNQVQSDLYSVGVLMFQLLYGKLPWFFDVSQINGYDVVDAVLERREKELDMPKVDKFELDEQLIHTIIKALSYEVENRFQTAEEFIQAIDGVIKVEKQSTKHKRLSEERTVKVSGIKQKQSKIIKGEGFAAIAGMEELKQLLRDEVLDILQNPEESKAYGISIANGMLLYGPPGCGKTFFAKNLAVEAGYNFMLKHPSDLMSKWVNGTQENIAAMFKEAEENAPTIIFIDEINTLVPNRANANIHEMSQHAVEEMLAQMDRTGEKGIFVIGATNYPDMIDPAILRAGRLEKKIYIGPPDKKAREELFKMRLQSRASVVDFGVDYEELSKMTEGYVSADIDMIVADSARKARKAKTKISMDLLRETISKTLPSLSKADLQKYETIHKQITNQQPEQKTRPHIGFR